MTKRVKGTEHKIERSWVLNLSLGSCPPRPFSGRYVDVGSVSGCAFKGKTWQAPVEIVTWKKLFQFSHCSESVGRVVAPLC